MGVPGYDLIQNVLRGFAEKRTAYPAALITLFGPGTGVFGLVMAGTIPMVVMLIAATVLGARAAREIP